MAGTILFTGANSSAGLRAVEQLLEHYSEFTAILMVRDAGVNDVNTQNLRQVIARYPQAKATIHQLDHSNLKSVQDFATTISAAIAAGEYPRVKAIVCNASYWNLVLDSELTADGYDKTIQVNYIAHVALVLRLLDSFDDEGRIVLLSSVGHYRKPNAVTSHIPEIPDDIDQLNRPPPDQDKEGRGFQRYANSKLLLTTWMYPLNRYLQQVIISRLKACSRL
jgi:NAD(P)-dependent dehydrogenase (short-subunit alcohol dehydrogenase family)